MGNSVGGQCTGSCEGTAEILTKPQNTHADAWKALSLIIGIYGYIKQFELAERMVDLAKQAQDRADRYYDLTKSHYDTIAVPTWTRMRDLYDRYTTFWNRENDFITCAYSKKDYCPDYALQEGRAVGRVQAIWDRAARQQSRAVGKYNSGRACHNATYFATMLALSKVDAANHAYRYEDQKKIQMDNIYWARWVQGAQYVAHMGDRGANGLNAGARTAQAGLEGVGRGLSMYMQANRDVAAAYGNMAQMWGGIANGAMKMAGFSSVGGMGGGMGMGQGGGYGGSFNNPYGAEGGAGGDTWGGDDFGGGNTAASGDYYSSSGGGNEE